MLAYEADTSWNKGIHCIFFKTLIQLYLLCSFLYYLIYSIKEVINCNIFWRLNLKSAGLWGSYCLKQGNPLQFFQNTDLILFFFLLYFWLTVSKRVSKAIFLGIKFKSVGLWGIYGLKQGNLSQNPKFSDQIVFFLYPDLLFYLMYQKGCQR